MDKTLLLLILAIITIIVIIVLLTKNKETFKESLSPGTRYALAGKWNNRGNGLMPSFNQMKSNIKWAYTGGNTRADRPMDYLPHRDSNSNEYKQGVSKNNDQTGGSIYDETNCSGSCEKAMQFTDADVAKSGRSSLSGVTYKDNSLPDTSELPVVVQHGIVDASMEQFCGGNNRICPGVSSSMLSSSKMILPKRQKTRKL